jgi:hypothetical protein
MKTGQCILGASSEEKHENLHKPNFTKDLGRLEHLDPPRATQINLSENISFYISG